MPIILKTIDGRLATEIPGAKGELHDYRVEPVAAEPPLLWALRLVRLDSDEAHCVELGLDGLWTCSCKDFEFRFRKNRGGGRQPGDPCKHIEFAREYRLLMGLGGNPVGHEAHPNA